MTRSPGVLVRTAEVVALGWALGMALYTTVFFALFIGGVGCGTAVAPSLVAAALGSVLGLWLLSGQARTGVAWGGASRAATVAGIGLSTMQAAIAVWIAMHSLLSYGDAWTVWGMKARLFAANGPPAGYFHSQPAYVSHPNYPLNLPLAEALFFRLPDPFGTRLAACVGAACFIALILLFYAAVTRLHGASMGALATGVLTAVPSLPRFAGYGYADVPVTLYSGGAVVYLALWWRFRERADLVLMGLLAGGAIWTKKEGLPLAALVLLAFVGGEVRRHEHTVASRALAITWAMIGTLTFPLPWLVFTWIVRPVGSDFYPVTIAVFLAHVDRAPRILSLFVREVLVIDQWSLFWIAVALSVAVTMPRWTMHIWGLFMVLLAQLGVYLGGYIFSDWPSYTVHIASSLNRLLIHLVPLAVLIAAEAIATISCATTDDTAVVNGHANHCALNHRLTGKHRARRLQHACEICARITRPDSSPIRPGPPASPPPPGHGGCGASLHHYAILALPTRRLCDRLCRQPTSLNAVANAVRAPLSRASSIAPDVQFPHVRP